MEQYQNIQNPQLYRQILEERRKKNKQENPEASFGNLSDVMKEFQNTKLKEVNAKTQEYYGVNSIRNTAKELCMPKWNKKEDEEVQREKTDALQWNQTSSEAAENGVSKDFYGMFREVGERTGDWISIRNFIKSKEGRTSNPYLIDLEPYRTEYTIAKAAQSLFKKSGWQNQQDLTEILEQEADDFQAYAKYGNDKELVDITDAKRFWKGDFAQEEWDALSSEQKEALLLWHQFYTTKSEIFEYLLANGERGAYTWENYYATIDKMNAIVKPDNTLWQGTKDFFIYP